MAKRTLARSLVLIFLSLLLFSHPTHSISEKVYVIPIKGVIDLGLSRFVERAVREAERNGARAIILEVNTFGGRVDAAVDIVDAISGLAPQGETPIETFAFVNPRAISAGALITLAAKHIIMAPGSSIGAATPVTLGPAGAGANPVGEKEVSFVRATFRSAAQRTGHSPNLAEAMVDPDIELYWGEVGGRKLILTTEELEKLKGEGKEVKDLKTVIPKGKLLTLTDREALEYGLGENRVEKIEDILSLYGLTGATLTEIKVNWAEKIVRVLTHPIVSSLLLTVGLLGIIFELQMPGWGISGTIGATCLALFFGGRYLYGLANIGDILLFLVGAALILLELFVIPGFGIAGITGILFLLASIYLAFVKSPIPHYSWDMERFLTALTSMGVTLFSVLVITLVAFRFLPHAGLFSRLILAKSEERKEGFTASLNKEDLVGKEGKTLTKLRPAGKVTLGKEIIDVVAQGEFIDRGARVKVVEVEGNRVVVEKVERG